MKIAALATTSDIKYMARSKKIKIGQDEKTLIYVSP